jgi:hypothetical protein
MKFKNKKTGSILETNSEFVKKQMLNSEVYEEVKETAKPKELTKAEIQAKLDELGIEYDSNAKKEDLLALLPQE